MSGPNQIKETLLVQLNVSAQSTVEATWDLISDYNFSKTQSFWFWYIISIMAVIDDSHHVSPDGCHYTFYH